MVLAAKLITIVIALTAATAQAPTGDETRPGADWGDYLRPSQLVPVENGRTLHLLCMGDGSPTVVLTAGFGEWALSWRPVQRTLARTTRVCSWDRAGFGYSSPSPMAQDSDITTADLSALLDSAGVPPPYILVGHSLGSYESLLLADRRPEAIAGMVLVDPSFPDQMRRMQKVAPALRAFAAGGFEGRVEAARRCREQLVAGRLLLDSPDPDRCLALPPDWPEGLRDAMRRQSLDPARTDTRLSFAASTMDGRNSELAINPDRNFRAMPLIVLTATRSALPPNLPEEAKAETPLWRVLWRHAHARLAALSSRGEQRLVSGAGHYIHHDRPEAVVDAVEEVIAATRQPPSP